MPTNYPDSKDTSATLRNDRQNATPQFDNHPPDHNNLADAVMALETRVGITDDPNTSSHDYLIQNHIHTAATIEFTPTGTVTATNVQAAITQLATAIDGLDSTHPDKAAHDLMGLVTTEELEDHRADSVGVHGLSDTALLETMTGAQAKANTAQANAQAYADATFQSLIEKNQPLGYAGLDASGLIPLNLLPPAQDVGAHIGTATDAHGAASISISDVAANFAAFNVEDALAEAMTAVIDHQASHPSATHDLDGPEHTDVDSTVPPQIGDTLVWNGTQWVPGASGGKRVEGPGRTHLDDSDYAVAPVDGTFGFTHDTETGQDFISWRSEGIWLSAEGG